MGKSFERRVWGAAIIVILAGASVLSVRRFVKPAAETAPEFRQKGPADAPITMVEFSDFQCPACRAAEPGIKSILNLYGDKIHFYFKHFPLTPRPHPFARQAAITGECAGRQGKFWEAHDLFYENQGDWAASQTPDEDLVKLAIKAGCDEKALRACIADPAAAAAVDADKMEGNDRWVGSTPTIFVNQRRFVNAATFPNVGTIWIDKILKTQAK